VVADGVTKSQRITVFVSDVNEAPSFPEAPAWLKGLTVEDLSEPGTRELPKMQVTTAPNIIDVDADLFWCKYSVGSSF